MGLVLNRIGFKKIKIKTTLSLTWDWWCLGDDMGDVEVDAPEVRMLGGDHAEAGAGVSPDVDEHIDIIEAAVDPKQLLHEDDGVAAHGVVEHLVQSRIGAQLLER